MALMKAQCCVDFYSPKYGFRQAYESLAMCRKLPSFSSGQEMAKEIFGFQPYLINIHSYFLKPKYT